MDPERSTPGFRIETDPSGLRRSVKAIGELDSGTCDALLEAFKGVIADQRAEQVSLDLQELSFIDSSGMRTMIQIERIADARGIPLVLLPPPEDVTELLRTAGLAERMNLLGDAEDAQLGPDFLDRVMLELDRVPTAPSRARAEIRDALAGRLDDAEIATVVLLTSELVTNAVIHPKAPQSSSIGLSISVYEDGVRVEVEDDGAGFDPAAPAVSSERGGRGLFLVDRCAASWGALRIEAERGRRFRVWFEFRSGDREAAVVGG